MREPSGASSSRRYLPVSQPPVSGENGEKPSPRSAHSGSTSASAERSSRLYDDCTHSKRARPRTSLIQSARASRQASMLLAPM